MVWIQARCPDLLHAEGLPDPQKIKEGAVIEGVHCSEADIHSLFMSHATTNEHGKPLASSTVRAARTAINYVYPEGDGCHRSNEGRCRACVATKKRANRGARSY
jgi:hypothetical protein